MSFSGPREGYDSKKVWSDGAGVVWSATRGLREQQEVKRLCFIFCLWAWGMWPRGAESSRNWVLASLVAISNRFLIILARHKKAAKVAKGAEVG